MLTVKRNLHLLSRKPLLTTQLNEKSKQLAHPHVEVKNLNPLTGEEAATNEQGELCTRGYLVMKGYYNMPEATKDAIDEDGWLHTGDLATMDEFGYVKITVHLKDMIPWNPNFSRLMANFLPGTPNLVRTPPRYLRLTITTNLSLYLLIQLLFLY